MQSLFHPLSITQIHQTPDSFTAVRIFREYIVTASDDGAVKIFSQNSGILTLKTLCACKHPHKRQIINMAASHTHIAVVWGSVLAIWDLSNYHEEPVIINVFCF